MDVKIKLTILCLCLFNSLCFTQSSTNCIYTLTSNPYYGTCQDHNTWPLTFSDEFNGVNLDASKWEAKTGIIRSNCFPDTFDRHKCWWRPENIKEDNGSLKIKVEISNLTTPWEECSSPPISQPPINLKYTTGEIWSHNTYHYGKYEIRCKIPLLEGLHPSFWMYEGNEDGNPIFNELDFFEFEGNERKHIMTIHRDYNNDGEDDNCNKELAPEDPGFYANWHTYTIIWTPYEISYYRDIVANPEPLHTFYRYHDKTALTPIKCGDLEPGNVLENELFPRAPMHIIAGVSVHSGNASGETAPTPTTDLLLPAYNGYEIDYIKYWARPASTIHPCSLTTLVKTSPFQGFYAADNAILSAGAAVINTAEITVNDHISILPSFQVTSGSSFKAKVDPYICGQSQRMGRDNPERNEAELVPEQISTSIYPNPNNGQFNVDIAGMKGSATIEVFDAVGRKIRVKDNSTNQTVINLTDQAAGIYLVKVTVDGKIFNHKIVYQ